MMQKPSTAYGQTARSPARLFEQGAILLDAADFAAACPLLQESYDLAPTAARLGALATCRDREGRSATALGLYREYLRAVGGMDTRTRKKHAEREKIATERIQVLEVEAPKLKLVWRGDVPKDVYVQVDGKDARGRINIEWQIDPGDHVLTIRSKNSAEESRTIKLERGRPRVDVDLTPEVVAKTPSQVAVQNPPPQSPSNSQRVLGFAALGIGAAGLATGAVFGGVALGEKQIVDANCRPFANGFDCEPVGRTAAESTLRWGNASTIAFAVGGVMAVVGLVLVFKNPKQTSGITARFQAGERNGFVSVEGHF